MAREAEAAARRRQAREDHRADLVWGVPSSIMGPRLALVAAVLGLTAFGIVMIFSSSSIIALSAEKYNNDPTYYLTREVVFVAAGVAIALGLSRMDYHVLAGRLLPGISVLTTAALLAILAVGQSANGASRWINLGGFTLQPSEFAKVAVMLEGAALLGRALGGEGGLTREELGRRLGLGIALPLGLVLLQPDKGTVMVTFVTLLVMAYYAGVPGKWCLGLVLVVGLAFFALSMAQEYSRKRILTMIDPWSDPTDDGYQLIQGFYAFGSGGLFGVGLGMGRQKYGYLPMAYSDFILATVGEECGLVGMLVILALFALLLWAGLKVAQGAPDLLGRLVASGSVTLLVVQMLLNAAGVVGAFPLSGKPVPFLSYGGSSVISSFAFVGLVLSVSRRSRVPLTAYDRRRQDLSVAAPARLTPDGGPSMVGVPTRRSERPAGTMGDAPRLTVVSGGRRDVPRQDGRPTAVPLVSGRHASPADLRQERAFERDHPGSRVTRGRDGRTRIDLGPDAGERLRTDGGGRGTSRRR